MTHEFASISQADESIPSRSENASNRRERFSEQPAQRKISLAQERESEVRKPDFFIVGAPKCGTTSLYTYLKAHPEIFMSPLKEPNFFAEDIVREFRRVRTLHDYLRCFAGATCEKRLGEASTTYLASRRAPIAIKAFQPSARVIIMLRDPVELMYSWHTELINDGVETFTRFEEALDADEMQQRDGVVFPGRRVVPSYRAQATFSASVRRYFESFGRQSVLVVLLDDFRTNPGPACRSVLQFLGVNAGFDLPFPAVNKNQEARNMAVQNFVRTPPRWVRRMSHATLPLVARRLTGDCIRWLNTRIGPRPPMSAVLRARLRQQCEPDIQELSVILGRDLKAWIAS